MRCFARWKEIVHGESSDKIYFRDQTILQFGERWELLASIVLLNPGSAAPMDAKRYEKLLESKDLPFYVGGTDLTPLLIQKYASFPPLFFPAKGLE